MASGGARRNSGPHPDPAALRRDRKDDATWVTLPTVHDVVAPEFPLEPISHYDIYFEDKNRVKEFDAEATNAARDAELKLWGNLWAKPQAVMWDRLGLAYEVAAYVRAYIESTGPDSNSGLKTAALRMAAEIGLSLPGMHSLRWKFSADEVSERRETAVKSEKVSARDRLRVIDSA